jgi:nucleotide-binding universal stress UspA family protein
MGAYLTAQRDQGEAVVANAEAITCMRGKPTDGLVADGPPAACLVALAEDRKAELTVVGSGRKHGASFLFGSVRRALAIGSKVSVLTAEESNCVGPVTAVFATDHSDYANRCLAKLLEWGPRGLRKVHVVTAFDPHSVAVKSLVYKLDSDAPPEVFVRQQLELKCQAAADQLTRAGYETAVHVVEGETNEVIVDAMKDVKADLLILGSQGHGFLERLLVGSVALHQVASAYYPILLIRV